MVTILGAQKIAYKIKDINVKEILDNHQLVMPSVEIVSMSVQNNVIMVIQQDAPITANKIKAMIA